MGKLWKHQKNKTKTQKKKKIIIEPNKHEMPQEYIDSRYKEACWLQSIGLQKLDVT